MEKFIEICKGYTVSVIFMGMVSASFGQAVVKKAMGSSATGILGIQNLPAIGPGVCTALPLCLVLAT